jgi:hypothetical protein
MGKCGPKKKRIRVNGAQALRAGSALLSLVTYRAQLYLARSTKLNRFDLIVLIAINGLKQAANELPGEADITVFIGGGGGHVRRALDALRVRGYVVSTGTYGRVYQCTGSGLELVNSFDAALEEERIRLNKVWSK